MNILFLEDRGSVSHYWKEMLEDAGHRVFDAPNLSRATSYLQDKPIDCLLIDCNLRPDGLKPEQVSKTHHGVITGWIWLEDIAFIHDESLRKRTILLTGYTKELGDLVDPNALEEVNIVDKDSANPAKRVLEFLALMEDDIISANENG